MKLRWKITVSIVALVTVCAVLFSRSPNREEKALVETRRALRQRGFKIDLTEFDFSASQELRARATALTNASNFSVPRSHEDAALRSMLQQVMPELMQTVGSNSAVAVWKLERWPVDPGAAVYLRLARNSGDNMWPALRESFNDEREALDAACAAALAGPIRFSLNASQGNAMLLPHVAALKNLTQTLGCRAILELHDGNKDVAWTNLAASTRLVTAWEPEPVEVSHLVRCACASLAFNTTWQALQAKVWTDAQLSMLQDEWGSVDFFKGLPETAAFARASAAATCQLERQRSPAGFGLSWNDAVRIPSSVWYALRENWRQLQYRHHGSFEDENGLLVYYRNREVELRRAIQSASWTEMRQLPGTTNTAPFVSKYRSRMQSLINLKQISLSTLMYASGGQARTLLGRVADAEARRRLTLAAIALERYRLGHGTYPNTLLEVAPEFLRSPPTDFLDGKPLRYHPSDDGHFVLYSVGLDCADNGGVMQSDGRKRLGYNDPREIPVRRGPDWFAMSRPGAPGGAKAGVPQGTDLVWPRPASAAEVEQLHQEQLMALKARTDLDEELQATEQWRRTARRQAQVEKILAAKPEMRPSEPTYRGRPLAEMLRNENDRWWWPTGRSALPSPSGTNKLTLDDLLTLKQVITGAEPEFVTFEVPITYDVLTNLGELGLYIDPSPEEDSDEGCNVGWLECLRATNGNCLLVWNTIYESPGKHALQMGLALNEPAKRGEELFVGPLAPFVVSNLCQFSVSSAHFNREIGATLHAKLPEPNCAYTIELKSPAGALVKTFTGSTSNGVIKVFWDLCDDHGNKCTNDSYDSVFQIALPDSGRSQTMKGP